MTEYTINKLETNEIEEVSEMLTDAFLTNPAYSIIFKNKEHLKEGLLWVFRTNLFLLNQKRVFTNVIKAKDSNEIVGTFTILPPEGVKTNLSTYFKIGIPHFISKFGINSLLRMTSLDSFNNKILTDAMQTAEYFYLHMVVVKEKYRGTGIGTFALKNAIRELTDSNPASRKLALTTQLPINVLFYARLGFTNLNEEIVNFKGDSYFNSNMVLNF